MINKFILVFGLFVFMKLEASLVKSSFVVENIQQQKIQVKGTVTDNAGDPLPGVSVSIQSTKKGTTTDFDGKYIIEANEDDVLIFSYVGMQTQPIQIRGRKKINVTLKFRAEDLDEVFVNVGYSDEQKKLNLATTTTTVKSEKVERRGVVSLGEALQGLAPNLNITPSLNGGEPGAGVSINIRGYASTGSAGGSPLILVDGFEQDINTIDPNNVESITVLEDIASGAIYGARSSFGVILIKTKSGVSEEPIVHYTSSVQAAQFRKIPKRVNSYDYAVAHDIARENDGETPYFKDRLERIKANLDKEPIATKDDDLNNNGTVDWHETSSNADHFNALFKSTSFRHQHNLAISGSVKYGNHDFISDYKYKEIRYNISGSYFGQGGHYKVTTDGFQRKNIGIKLEVTPLKWLTSGFNIRYTRRKFENPNYGKYSFSNSLGLIYHDALRTWPTTSLLVKTNNGKLRYLNDSTYGILSQASTVTDIRDNIAFQAKFELEPIENWKTFLKYSIRTSNGDQERYRNSVYSYLLDDTKVLRNEALRGKYDKNIWEDFYLYPQIYTQYELELPTHYLKVMAGFEQEEHRSQSLSATREGVVTDEVPSISTGTGDRRVLDGKNHWSTRSVFASLTYTFDKKYVINGTFRYDGSSKFIKEKRWGAFYSYALAYNLENEEFLKPILESAKIDKLKLKFSMGRVGNQNIGLYQFIERVPISTRVRWISDGERGNYASVPSITNKDATWETVTDINIGFELNALNNRLSSGFTYFKRTTVDMLGPVAPLPSTLGSWVPRANSAELATNGWGLTLNWKDQIGDFNYNLTFLLSDSQTEITKYYNPTNLLSEWYVGEKVGQIWGYETVDIMDEATAEKVNTNSAATDTKGTSEFPNQSKFRTEWSEGDIRYKDLDGDGKITSGDETLDRPGDRKIIGNSTPRYTYSLNTAFTYKDLTLTLFFQGVGSRQIDLGTAHGFGSRWQTLLFQTHLDYWTENNKDAFYPKPYFNTEKNRQTQTKYLADASYIRLKTASLTYKFKPTLLKQIGLKSASIFFSADNLLTYTKMVDYIDPELTGSRFGSGAGKSYPLYRTYVLGVNLSF